MILSWYRALALVVTAVGLLIVTAAQEPKQHPASDMSLMIQRIRSMKNSRDSVSLRTVVAVIVVVGLSS